MNIIGLSVRIAFQKSGVITDKYGNHKNSWTDYFTCWATAGPFSGKESTGSVINQEETICFTVRWCKELETVDSTRLRIICRDKIYNIQHVNPMGFKNKSIKFTCSLERSVDERNDKD